MPTLTDFVFGPGTSIGAVQGVFVQLTNNVSSAVFVSSSATDSTGKFTVNNVPPGVYTLATGPTVSGPFTTQDANYIVGDTPGDHLLSSGTVPTISNVNVGISSTSIIGNDRCGVITIATTGTPPAAGNNLFTLNFAASFAFTPVVMFTSQSGSVVSYVGSSPSVSSIAVFNIQVMPTSATVLLGYMIMQPRVV